MFFNDPPHHPRCISADSSLLGFLQSPRNIYLEVHPLVSNGSFSSVGFHFQSASVCFLFLTLCHYSDLPVPSVLGFPVISVHLFVFLYFLQNLRWEEGQKVNL